MFISKMLKMLVTAFSILIISAPFVSVFSKTLIGVSWRHFQEERWRIDEAGIKDELAKLGDEYVYISADAQSDPMKQISDVEGLLARGISALILLPQDSDGIVGALGKVVDEGIPVIAYDIPIDHPDAVFLSFDNVAVGRLEAQPLADIHPHGRWAIIKGDCTMPIVDLFFAGQQEVINPLIESDSKENPSPDGGTLSDPRNFNLMFKTFIGPVEDSSSTVYLRPETAQAMFVNFLNVLNSSRKKIPFGIAQQGKSFRNEITPGNFTFRTREFEQMEMEFFCSPDDDEKWHDYWIQFSLDWFKKYGIREENLMIRKHESEELPHYSKASSDIDYLFPWSWGELETISNRTDYDLKAHSELSGKDLSYFDQENNKRFTPYVIEPAMGADRSVLAFLCDAYFE